MNHLKWMAIGVWFSLGVNTTLLGGDSANVEKPAGSPTPGVGALEGDPHAGSLVVEFLGPNGDEITPLYNPATGVENFEAGFPDPFWEVGDLNGADGNDFWDDTTCNPLTGSRSAWAAGNGSQPDCVFYDDNMESFMCVEAAYSGSSLNATDRFYFNFWNEVEECCDYMWVSIGGFTHEPLHGIGVCTPHVVASQAFGSTSGCGGGCPCYHGRCWTSVRVRLGSGFDNTPFLRICFRFHSDHNTTRKGAYFDDIRFNGLSDTKIFPKHGGFDGNDCTGNPFCGGIAGTPCPAGQECYFGPGMPCGTSDRIGECRQFPPVCPNTDAPVCGCNGVTYQNDCFAARAHAEVRHVGSCCVGTCCNDNSDCNSVQFCGRDDGDCNGEGGCLIRPISCPGTIDPVCGCDGQTYDNRCKASQAGASVAHAGSCTPCPGGPFTIGGAVYSDCADPITTGIDDVVMNVTCGANQFTTMTNGPQGLWQLANVPCGMCTVCPSKPGLTFAHVGPGCQEEGECHNIIVNQSNQGANQSIQFLGIEEDCTLYDLNEDGFPSIVGDVPLAVDCIYRNDCNCPEEGCLCPADCNCDGFLSIIGDIPCLVDCFYRQVCTDLCTNATAAITATPASNDGRFPTGFGGFTIGGAIYTNLDDPISSGLSGVEVTLTCAGRPDDTTMTAPGQGLWSFSNVPEGTCTVTPVRSGHCFEHVNQGVPRGETTLTITVDAAHAQQNQSLQFLASTDSGDPDQDTVLGCADVCPSSAAPAGVDDTGRPLGDLNDDCAVNLQDFQILQNNFSGP